jgi:2-polyprenyl-3-methyl-5-hydroxy-6-metoxy-1,4-benzoquinol methylase
MSPSEIDRRLSERDVADRRYNDALTNVDRALPALPPATAAAAAPDLDTRSVRDRVAILPAAPPDLAGWRGWLARFVWRLVAPVFTRQQEFNAQIAQQLESTAAALRQLAAALPQVRTAQRADLETFVSFNSILIQYLQQITPFIDTKTRALEASLDEVRMAATAAQRAAVAARREIERLPASRADVAQTAAVVPAPALAMQSVAAGSLGARYVGFEDLFRGSPDAIRARQAGDADRFIGASDVIDLGCGRGEFLELLRDRGVSAVGVDTNAEMVDVCRSHGLRAEQGDALTYLSGLSDESSGGVAAFQVVEHLQPEYLVRVLETAHAKLRPGAPIVLETINAACWVAFFESYIRDITHVRPLHPETLKFLAIAAGFENVDVHFRSPIAEGGRLQRIDVSGLPRDVLHAAGTINANVDRLNDRLFTYLDYAIVGRKGR